MHTFLTFINNRRSAKFGFTLIELLVVIAIIGVLASIVLASLNSARRKSRDSRRITDIKQIQLALELFFDASGNTYPLGTATCNATTLAWGLEALQTAGYIPQVPRDPLSSVATPICYRYAVPTASGSQTTYHLAANLEETTNPALNGDKDCNSATGSGCPVASAYLGVGATSVGTNETTGCSAEAGRACYDAVP